MSHPAIFLASQSPRRQELLRQLGVRFELLLPQPDEDAEALEATRRGESPSAYVRRVTGLKLQAAVQRWAREERPRWPVLCADTTVALGRRILGKPQDDDEAAAMLQALSGRRHRVHTAVALALPSRRGALKVHEALCTSVVQFAPLSAADIRAYVATGQPRGKAGAYAIQGQAAQWIPRITGSHSGIMGLPLSETATLLRQLKVAF